MPNGTPTEVKEILTFHRQLNRSYNLGLKDYDAARELGHEIRAAHEVKIITTEMKQIIFDMMCRREQEIEDWQKGLRDDVDF
jgi:hypothetical protein